MSISYRYFPLLNSVSCGVPVAHCAILCYGGAWLPWLPWLPWLLLLDRLELCLKPRDLGSVKAATAT